MTRDGMHYARRTVPPLTVRQRQVLALVANGRQDKEIALLLGMGRVTVRHHLEQIRQRLGAFNTPHAVAIGLRRGLIT